MIYLCGSLALRACLFDATLSVARGEVHSASGQSTLFNSDETVVVLLQLVSELDTLGKLSLFLSGGVLI